MAKTHRLILVRHGESTWNQDNRFTGWEDVDLSEKGRAEAQRAGLALKQELLEHGHDFDHIYCSVLRRALQTAWTALDKMDRLWLPMTKDWRLNERHYGALTGLNKAETAARHGEEQVKIWRRSYDTPPPQLDKNDARHPSHDPKYRKVDASLLPSGESLKDTVLRFLPLWENDIRQRIQKGERVALFAHGNSLRALIQHLEQMTPEQIMEVNMPTGVPLLYELKEASNKTGFEVLNKQFLGDADTVKAAIEAVANQGKAGKH